MKAHKHLINNICINTAFHHQTHTGIKMVQVSLMDRFKLVKMINTRGTSSNNNTYEQETEENMNAHGKVDFQRTMISICI